MKRFIFLLLLFSSSSSLFAIDGELFFRIKNFGTTTWQLKFEKIAGEIYWDINFNIVTPPDLFFTNTGNDITIQADAIYDDNNNGTLDDFGNEFLVYYGKFKVTITDGIITKSFRMDYKDCDYSASGIYKYTTPDVFFKFEYGINQFIWTNSTFTENYEDYTNSIFKIWERIKNPAYPLANYTCFSYPVIGRNILDGSDYGELTVNYQPINSGESVVLNYGNNTFSTYTELQQTNYKFRSWITGYNEVYDNPATISIFDDSDVSAFFYPTQALTVANNLEGGSSNNNFEITWHYPNPDIVIPWQFGTIFNAFDYQVNEDLYSVEATTTLQSIGTSWFFRNWNDGSTNNIKSNIQVTIPSVTTAYYKGINRSNNPNAYSNNSQRKFVKTPDGSMYIVYESLGYVWLERSTNNGSSWEIMNDGNPLGNNEAISPCIDYYHRDIPEISSIVVSYQEKYLTNYVLKYVVYNAGADEYRYGNVENEINPLESISYSFNAQMVVTWNGHNDALFIWKGVNSLFYSLCNLTEAQTTWREDASGSIGSSSSGTPTLYSSKSYVGATRYFHLAYGNLITEIVYRKLQWNYITESFRVLGPEYVSQNSGYSQNYSPSITGITISNLDEIKLTWMGYREYNPDGPPGGGAIPYGETRVLLRSRSVLGGWSLLSVFGDNVETVNINKTSTEAYAFGWSQVYGSLITNYYVKGGAPPSIESLNTTGKDVQVNNSTTFDDMFLNSFQSVTLPYSFSISDNFSGNINKEQISIIYQGREGVVTKDTAQFYFAVGDITLNGESIDFIELADSVLIEGKQMLNSYLISAPFAVNNNSSLTYGVQYGVTDSAYAVEALSDGSTINFKVELIDDQTGELLGSFDDITYSESNVFQYNNIGYQVDMSGIGSRTVKFKLIVSTSADCDYSLSKRYADESLLAKTGYKKVTYKGSLAVEDYSLAQNYPNPFNPSTTIKYQIPASGNVTLKIYDILGSAVATLVDDFQNEGRYEASFNASSLASGVYLYRLKVNDFVNTKKMILIK